MKRRTARMSALARKRAQYEAGQKPEGESKYARKARWLARHDKFGFQVPNKPWKG
jgi:hypothetical protein